MIRPTSSSTTTTSTTSPGTIALTVSTTMDRTGAGMGMGTESTTSPTPTPFSPFSSYSVGSEATSDGESLFFTPLPPFYFLLLFDLLEPNST